MARSDILFVNGYEAQIDNAVSVLRNIPNGAEKAVSLAIGRSLEAGRTQASKAVRESYTVKQRDILPTFKMKKGRMFGELWSRGKGLPMSAFQYRPHRETTGRNRTQVRVTIKKGNTEALRTGFVHNGMILMRHASEPKVRKAYSVSVPQMIDKAEVRESVQDRIEEVFLDRVNHEVDRILAKGKA